MGGTAVMSAMACERQQGHRVLTAACPAIRKPCRLEEYGAERFVFTGFEKVSLHVLPTSEPLSYRTDILANWPYYFKAMKRKYLPTQNRNRI